MQKPIPQIIVALHLPEPTHGKMPPMSYLEDYVYQNMTVFEKGGIPAVILQDETSNTGKTRPETIAMMAALGRMIRENFPKIELGIIVESHDPYAPIAIAHACGASFVRIKVFVGAMLKAGGIQEGCGIDANHYRHLIGGANIRILADVHDRVGFPLLPVPITQAAGWAVRTGADALILTGSTFDESTQMVKAVKDHGVSCPVFIGGSITSENVRDTLGVADGGIVSSALKKDLLKDDDLIRWDIDKIKSFMERAGA